MLKIYGGGINDLANTSGTDTINVQLTSQATDNWSTGTGGKLVINGPIGGTGAITFGTATTGEGTIVLNGGDLGGTTSVRQGANSLQAGTIQVNNNAAFGITSGSTVIAPDAVTFLSGNDAVLTTTATGGVSLANNFVLTGGGQFGGTGNMTVTGGISGAGALTKSGTATLTLAGNGTFTGGTVINNGVVNVSSNAAGGGSQTVTTLGLGTGATFATGLAAGSNITITNATGVAVGQLISGAGIAAGTTITSVSGTTIQISTATTTASAGTYSILKNVTTNASTVTSGATTITVSSTSNIAVGDFVYGNGIASGTYVTGVNTTTKVVTLSYATTAATATTGNSFAFGGANQIVVTSTTGLTGGETVTGTGVGGPSGGAVDGNPPIGNIVNLIGNNTQITTTTGVFNAWDSLGSGAITFGGGTLQYSSTSTNAADYSARIAAGTSASAVSIDTNGQSVAFGTALTSSQSGGLTLNDTAGTTGTLTLNAANGYTGLTTITAGTLKNGIVNAIGSGSSVLLQGGTWNVQGFNDSIGGFTITSGTLNGSATVTAPTYALQGGTINANLGAGTATVTSGTTILNGTLSAGTVNINSGTLQNGALNVVSSGSNVAIGGGIWNLQANNDTVNGFTITSGSLNGTGTAIASTYALQGGTINAKLGAGAITVSSGTTTLGSGGRLNSGASLAISSGQLSLGGAEGVNSYTQSGGTLGGTGTLTSSGGPTFNGTSTTSTIGTNAALASSTGATLAAGDTLTVNGKLSDTLSVGSGSTLNGSSGTITGLITVSSGTISGTSLGMSGGATFSGSGNSLSGSETGAVALTGGSLTQAGTLTGSVTQSGSSALTVNGAITGDALGSGSTLTGSGNAGAVTLAGSNTLSGATTLTTSGIVVSGTGNSISSGTVTGAVTFSGTSALAINGTAGSSVTEGSASTVSGTGTITGALTMTGGSIVNLQDSNIGTLHGSTLSLTSGTGNGILSIDVGSGHTTDLLSLSSSASLANNFTINVNALTGASTGTTYTFISASGGLTLADFTAGSLTGTLGTTDTISFSGGGSSVTLTINAPSSTYYYTGVGGTNFSTPGNYNNAKTSGTAETGALTSSTDVVIAADGPSNLAPVVSTATSINSLTFNPNAGGASVSGTGTLTVAAGGITDSVGGTSTESISAPIALGAAQSWTVTNAGNTLAVSGTVSGTGSLTVAGSGTTRITGNNSYSGGTTVNSGATLLIGNGTSGSATGTGGSLTVSSGGTIGGYSSSVVTSPTVVGTSNSTSFAISGKVIVGTGTDTASELKITGSSASTITNANLVFNLKTTGNQANLLDLGSTAVTFSGTTLTLNIVGANVIGAHSDYTLITDSAGFNSSGLTLGGSVNGGGHIILGGLSIATTAFFGAETNGYTSGFYNGSYLYLDASGDNIDVEVVPEPSTWAMMIGGLGVLLFWQRRKGKRN